jgi:hypothetical protein
MRDVFHWGLMLTAVVLGIALLVGVTGVWGAKGTVMWITRVAFLGALLGTFWSIMARRRDGTPPN